VWDAVYFCCNVARDRRTENLCQVDAVTPRGTMNRQKCPQAEVCATAKVVRVKGRPGWPAVRACKQPLLRSETCKKSCSSCQTWNKLKVRKREKERRKQDNRGVLMLEDSKSDAGAYTKSHAFSAGAICASGDEPPVREAIGVQSA